MKASELIVQLQTEIDKYGDLTVQIFDNYEYDYGDIRSVHTEDRAGLLISLGCYPHASR